MSNIKQALRQAVTLLTSTSPSAQIDAEVLLAHTLNTSRTFLYTHPEKILTDTQNEAYQALIAKRSAGSPIAYLTQYREFWSLPLRVSDATLIPRPETELLVELTLNFLKHIPSASILDLGTGSGAIALALASERPNWQILACDKSTAAVEMAQENAAHLGLSNVKIIKSDWFTDIPAQQFDAIVSNPPYIAADDPHLKEGDVRFEPLSALVSGKDGLESLTHIINHSYERLIPGGFLLMEHGFQQKEAVIELLNQYGYEHVQCWQDWQGHERVSGGWRKK
jgi:release factor glutamine methyltransferase